MPFLFIDQSVARLKNELGLIPENSQNCLSVADFSAFYLSQAFIEGVRLDGYMFTFLELLTAFREIARCKKMNGFVADTRSSVEGAFVIQQPSAIAGLLLKFTRYGFLRCLTAIQFSSGKLEYVSTYWISELPDQQQTTIIENRHRSYSSRMQNYLTYGYPSRFLSDRVHLKGDNFPAIDFFMAHYGGFGILVFHNASMRIQDTGCGMKDTDDDEYQMSIVESRNESSPLRDRVRKECFIVLFLDSPLMRLRFNKPRARPMMHEKAIISYVLALNAEPCTVFSDTDT
jgi:hypothetical protein